jgi:hypothetical protein
MDHLTDVLSGLSPAVAFTLAITGCHAVVGFLATVFYESIDNFDLAPQYRLRLVVD